MAQSSWSSDVPISMPRPSADAVMVQMFGFGYTQYGIAHDMDETDYSQIRQSHQPPDVSPDATVLDDLDVETGEGDFL